VQIDSTYGQPPTDMAGQAALVEDMGFDACWIGETNSDPFLKCLQAAEATSRISVGTAAAIAFARSPMTLAYTGYDLARLSQGRFVLGLGSQVKAHVERRFSMPWTSPAPRMREMLLALRAIWASWQDGSKLNFDGEFYHHTLMTPFFSPEAHSHGAPPIYLAAVGPEMTAVAGEVADGLILHPFTTPKYLAEVTLPAIDRARRHRHDATGGACSVGGPVFVCVGRDDAELAQALSASRQQLAFYASTPAYRPVLDVHGWGDLQPELTKRSKSGDWDRLAELVDDKILSTFAAIGNPESVASELHARWGGLADRISLYAPYQMRSETMQRLIAAFRDESALTAD
jgi:probable F420-dependent oxidoreductase